MHSRRRTMGLLLILTLALLAAPATGQDACTQATPCPWTVDVGPDGFDDAVVDEGYNFTAGDWYHLDVFNTDDVAHLVTFEGHLEVEVPPFAHRTSAPFAIKLGTFELQDSPTGDVTLVHGFATDVVEREGSDDPDRGAGDQTQPWPAVAALLVLVGAALWRRP